MSGATGTSRRPAALPTSPASSRLVSRLRGHRRGDALFLCYHAVSARWPAVTAVRPERLEEQVRLLLARGYAPVTFSEAAAAPPGARVAAITFDDGYRSVLVLAFPILARLGAPATVFVPTAHVGTGAPMAWPGIARWQRTPFEHELVGMSWEELAVLARAGWEIGSHTCSHPRLTQLDDRALADELARSRAECEERLGTRCRSLSYPYGDLDARVVAAAQAAGYRAATSPPTRGGHPPAMTCPRVGVYPRDDLRRFRLKVSPAGRRVRGSALWPGAAAAGRRLSL